MENNYILDLFVSKISEFSVKDLEYAIQNDVSISKLLIEHESKLIRLGKLYALLKKKEKDLLTLENIILLLEMKRPDMASYMKSSRKNLIWLNRQIEEIKRLLWG